MSMIRMMLELTRDKLTAEGWTQFSPPIEKFDTNKRKPFIVALHAVNVDLGWYNQELDNDVIEHFKRINGMWNLFDWECKHGRTQTEVLQAIDKAIALA